MKGFLGTGATFRADLNLIVQLAMGVALLVGMYLARKKKFKAHKYCQSTVMILNLVMIALIMAPSFHKQVQPEIFGGLKDGYYLVPFIHTVLGTIAELLGLYLVLAAGTKILPKKLPYKRYKPLMRTCLALWWLVILLGVGTYYYWYVKPEPMAPKLETKATTPEPANPDAPRKVTVNIKNFEFSPKEVTIAAGTTVEWIDEQGKHTVKADDGSFKSETLTANGKFEHKFESSGTYPYYCEFHGDKHGTEMSGVVKVTESSK